MDNVIDTLKQPESNPVNLSDFTDEQVDAVILYLAKLARETHNKHGLSKEQKEASLKKFLAIMDSWPKEFCTRVQDRIFDTFRETEKNRQPNFWAAPADAMIEATKAVEFGVEE
jgi:hypothetical protein